jgi:hypothetical protein
MISRVPCVRPVGGRPWPAREVDGWTRAGPTRCGGAVSPLPWRSSCPTLLLGRAWLGRSSDGLIRGRRRPAPSQDRCYFALFNAAARGRCYVPQLTRLTDWPIRGLRPRCSAACEEDVGGNPGRRRVQMTPCFVVSPSSIRSRCGPGHAESLAAVGVHPASEPPQPRVIGIVPRRSVPGRQGARRQARQARRGGLA